jgi:hypothetical protein
MVFLQTESFCLLFRTTIRGKSHPLPNCQNIAKIPGKPRALLQAISPISGGTVVILLPPIVALKENFQKKLCARNSPMKTRVFD